MNLEKSVRNEVVKKTLEYLTNGDVPYDIAAIRALNLEVPEMHTAYVSHLERSRVQEFLKDECESYEVLDEVRHYHAFTGDYDYEDPEEDATFDSFVWYYIQWKGEGLIVYFYPKSYGSSFLAIGTNPTAINRFANCVQEFSNRPKGRVLVYSDGAFSSSPQMDEEVSSIDWSRVYLPHEQKRQIMESAESFFNNQSLYESLGVAWKRGILAVGPPGTGKTMLCKAMIRSRSEPVVYLRDLASAGSPTHAIKEVFERARKIAPCFLILEDIDGLINSDYGAVRTTFLNELDGMQPNHGILTFATSNHPQQIDEALLKRPSRFDRVFRVEMPGFDEREDSINEFVEKAQLPLDTYDQEKMAEETKGFTIAYIKEAFVGSLLEYAHQGVEPDGDYYKTLMKHVKELKASIKDRLAEDSASILASNKEIAGFSNNRPSPSRRNY